MKKLSAFKKILIIYIIILSVAIILIDIFVWLKLSHYEKQVQIEKASSDQSSSIEGVTIVPTEIPVSTSTPTPTPSPSPTPTEVPKCTYVAEVPYNVNLYINDTILNTEHLMPTVVATDTFDVLYNFSETYSEYADIDSKIEIPSIYCYEFQAEEGAQIIAKDNEGTEVLLEESIDKNGNKKYSCGFVSDNSNYADISALAFEAIETYALFCTNDGEAAALEPYFPDDSEYLAVISKMDNSWYMKHPEPPIFSEHTVLDYVGYSDSLIYIKITLKQTLFQSNIGANKTTEITHPMWFIKMNDEWKIAAMEF